MVKNLFETVAPLNAEAHAGLSFDTSVGYGFTSGQPVAPMQIGEFAIAAREYPIVFLRKNDKASPVAVLGFTDGENLFVDADGAWQGNYTPAFFRLYPFVITHVADDDRVILGLAEDHPGLNSDGQGIRLFEDNGEAGDLVEQTQKFAKRFAQQSMLTDHFASEIENLGILSTLRITMKGPDGKDRAVGGMYAVDRKKLAALDQDRMLKLVKSGALEAIYLHLSSLQNMKEVAKRLGGEAELPDAEEDVGLATEDLVKGKKKKGAR